MNGRLIYSQLKAKGVDGAIFFDEVSQHYLSDFYTTDGVVVVCGDETALFTDSRYIEAAQSLKNSGKMSDDVNVYLINDLYRMLDDYFASHSVKALAFDPALVTVARLEKLKARFADIEFVSCPDICTSARRIKSPSEVEKIKAAQAITDLTFEHILTFIRPNMTEIEVAAEMEYFMRKNGASGLAFETIAVSGKNSSLPHGVPTKAVLTENSFFTMDFGARFEGYCSDMTRTIVIGKATDEMKYVYDTVYQAQAMAINASKAGVKCSEIDSIARSFIASRGFGDYFGHGLGHSLGLEIHESPRYSPKCDDMTEVGHILTVEPGIYLPAKFGVRIEDMVLITEDGHEDLTHSPKQLIELK